MAPSFTKEKKMDLPPAITIRALSDSDRTWCRGKMIELWGAEIVVAHGEIFQPAELPGFVAEEREEAVGLLTYHISEAGCEIITIDSWREGIGIGTRLIESAQQAAVLNKCKRLWLVTTNDNLHALGFYQKRGFVLCAVRLNVFEKHRLLKPEIPLVGESGIPIRDEIELEMIL
jgi:ribosomal protein S18 acetylase RimI-like enzyme